MYRPFFKLIFNFPATVAVVYYKSDMSSEPLDINQELALGVKAKPAKKNTEKSPIFQIWKKL